MTALPGELEALAGDALEPRGRGSLPRHSRFECPRETVERLQDGLEIQLLLGPEVAVDRPLSHPGPAGHLVDQDLVELLLREDARSGFQDFLLLRRRLEARH